MGKLNNEVKKLLEETKTWVLSTCDDKPNAVPVFFTSTKDDDPVSSCDTRLTSLKISRRSTDTKKGGVQ